MDGNLRVGMLEKCIKVRNHIEKYLGCNGATKLYYYLVWKLVFHKNTVLHPQFLRLNLNYIFSIYTSIRYVEVELEISLLNQ